MRIEIPGFDAVKEGFEPLPAGRYTVLISNADVKPTKDGKSKIIAWELTVLGPTDAGRKVWLNNSLKTEALWNVKALLKAANVPSDAGGFATENAVGSKLDVQVDQEEYQGTVRNRISPPYYPSSLA